MRTKAGIKIILILFLTSVLTISFNITMISMSSDNVIIGVYGSTPTIDGLIEDSEWNDASTLIVSVTDGANCTVYAKQDGVNLYVCFNISDATYNSSDRCVIIFDINHDGNTSLQIDDMWLRVSRKGAMVENNVTRQNGIGWFTTAVSGWIANTSSISSGWQSEYNITYSKLDVAAGTSNTLGITFLIIDEDVEMGWYVWPSTTSISKPETWGDMTPNGYNWVPEFPTWAIMLLLLIVPTVVIAIYKRGLKMRARMMAILLAVTTGTTTTMLMKRVTQIKINLVATGYGTTHTL